MENTHMNMVEDLEKEFARRLREEREKAKISQLDLALKAELSQNLVNFIETGKRIPNLHTILKLCTALNISPSILFKDTEEEKEDAKQKILELVQRYL
jgi:transcriptional regulator with XRE-family HTH domain